MRKIIPLILVTMLVVTACRNSSYRFEGSLGNDYDGQTVVLANYDDSTAIDSVKMQQGRFLFEGEAAAPQMAMLMVDGKVRAYVVLEEGNITLQDSTHFATGTVNNNLLNSGAARLDSIENLDDMQLYVKEVRVQYEANKASPLGLYYAVELSRYLELPEIDKMLAEGTGELKESRRVARYRKAAELRKATLPGMKFTDFTVVQPDGKEMKLSDFVGNGKYLLVDFWASWCPYCIKELPTLKEIYSTYDRDKLEILGVAVRDRADDTKAAIDKYGIAWPVMYNAQRIPYDIYGFTGIPHLMLIAPDGTIVARGETAAETATRLKELVNN